MRWTSALAIFALFWALSVFFVLPFHARRSGDVDTNAVRGQADGAPVHFAIGRAALQVTIVALVLFALYYLNYINGWITRDTLNFLARPPA